MNIKRLYTLLRLRFMILTRNCDNFRNINLLGCVVEMEFVLYEAATGLTGWSL